MREVNPTDVYSSKALRVLTSSTIQVSEDTSARGSEHLSTPLEYNKPDILKRTVI